MPAAKLQASRKVFHNDAADGAGQSDNGILTIAKWLHQPKSWSFPTGQNPAPSKVAKALGRGSRKPEFPFSFSF